MGSIADRMKALSGKGMDVGPSSKRMSKGLSGSPTVAHKSAAMGGMSVTGGAGTFGPARMVGEEQRPPAASSLASDHPFGDGHRPAIAPKPKHPVEPSSPAQKATPSAQPPAPTTQIAAQSAQFTSQSPPAHEREPSIQQTVTGSSSRSGKSMGSQDKTSSSAVPIRAPSPQSPRPDNTNITPPSLPNRPMVSNAGSKAEIAQPEPSAHAIQPSFPQISLHSGAMSNGNPSAASPRLPDRLDGFEKAFPSLDEFGKQFEVEESPNGAYPFEREGQPSTPQPAPPNGDRPNGGNFPHLSLPDTPSFPDLPSAPTGRPGLPPPPSRPDSLKSPETKGLGPPSADAPLKRSASTANVSTLAGPTDLLSDSPTSEFPPEPPAPPAILRPSEPVQTRSPEIRDPSPSLSFPVAKPTPGPLAPKEPSKKLTKPKFPFSNSIEPDTIRTYLLNPAVDILLLDTRSEEEYQRSHVGQEYEARSAKVTVVWMDPTVLMRNECDPPRLPIMPLIRAG